MELLFDPKKMENYFSEGGLPIAQVRHLIIEDEVIFSFQKHQVASMNISMKEKEKHELAFQQ